VDRENGLSRLRLVGPAIAGENLVLKAARELEGQVSRPLPFTIRLFKRIPMGAGLGAEAPTRPRSQRRQLSI